MNACMPAAPGTRVSEVQEEYDKLRGVTSAILEELSDLDTQLCPILRQEAPQGKEPQDKICKVIVPLAESLRQNNANLFAALERIRSIRGRIEV